MGIATTSIKDAPVAPPKLMNNGECIIFINDDMAAMVLVGNKKYKPGEIYEEFDLKGFVDFKETLELRNA